MYVYMCESPPPDPLPASDVECGGEFSPSVSPLSIDSEILDDLLPQSPVVVYTPTQPLPSVHSMVAGFETEYLELNNTTEIRCSQEAIVNWAQTSTLFFHSIIYRDFFANEVQHRKLSKIVGYYTYKVLVYFCQY